VLEAFSVDLEFDPMHAFPLNHLPLGVHGDEPVDVADEDMGHDIFFPGELLAARRS
jgi:hypothetical protein